MATSTKFPSSNQAAGSPFNGSWTNPNNAHADDGVYATAAPNKNQEYASLWFFDFSDIPSASTINSVTIEVQWKVSTTSSVATVRSTAFADSGQSTILSADPGYNDTAEPTTDTIRTYTFNPTLAQVQAGFYVRVQMLRGNSNTAVTASLDYVKATVDYTSTIVSDDDSGRGVFNRSGQGLFITSVTYDTVTDDIQSVTYVNNTSAAGKIRLRSSTDEYIISVSAGAGATTVNPPAGYKHSLKWEISKDPE